MIGSLGVADEAAKKAVDRALEYLKNFKANGVEATVHKVSEELAGALEILHAKSLWYDLCDTAATMNQSILCTLDREERIDALRNYLQNNRPK